MGMGVRLLMAVPSRMGRPSTRLGLVSCLGYSVLRKCMVVCPPSKRRGFGEAGS
jgi:hypothetical protein